MLFIVGLIAGYLAFKIGKWRQTCIFWMINNRANVPLGWYKDEFRIGSLLLVTLLSLVFATSWAYLLIENVSRILGMFSWGILLAARWHASGITAQVEGQRQMKEIEKDISQRNAERERQQAATIENIPDYKGPPADPKVAAEIERILAEIRGKKQ